MKACGRWIGRRSRVLASCCEQRASILKYAGALPQRVVQILSDATLWGHDKSQTLAAVVNIVCRQWVGRLCRSKILSGWSLEHCLGQQAIIGIVESADRIARLVTDFLDVAIRIVGIVNRTPFR